MNRFCKKTNYYLIVIVIVYLLNILMIVWQMIKSIFSNDFFEISFFELIIKSSFVYYNIQTFHIRKFIINFAYKFFVILFTKID